MMCAKRSMFGDGQRLVARLLIAASLLPTGPVMGLGLLAPEELGIAVVERVPLDGRELTVRVRTTTFDVVRDRAARVWSSWPPRFARFSVFELPTWISARGGSGGSLPFTGGGPRNALLRWLQADGATTSGSSVPAPQAQPAAGDPSDPWGIREGWRRPVLPAPPTPPDFALPSPGGAANAVARPGTLRPAAPVPLAPAWNLVSISWTPGDPSPAAVLAPVASSIVRAFAFDACDPSDPWKLYDPSDPGESDLAAITPAKGFWLETTGASTIPEAGPEPAETSIPLCVGWNLVGFPRSSSQAVATALATIAGRYLRVFGFDPSDAADPWEVYDVGVPAWANDLQEMRPGRGYWIYATEATTLVVSNSTDAPTVSFVAPADLAEVTERAPVVGTVRSTSLAGWELSFREAGVGGWTSLATGIAPVEASPLATFDPTLLENGLYELRLHAVDTLGQVDEATIALSVEGQQKIGHFSLTFVDLEVPLAGLPIQVLRGYDSRRRGSSGDFGYGWKLELKSGTLRHNRIPGEGWQLAGGFLPCEASYELDSHQSTVRLSDREVYRFRPVLSSLTPTAGGCFATFGYAFVDGPIPGATLEVVGNRQVFYTNGGTQLVDTESFTLYEPAKVRLRTRDGRQFELDRPNGVTRIVDANGNRIDFTPTGISHSNGVSIVLERDGQGRITRVVDPAGAELLYGYGGSGDLATFTDRAASVTSFAYGAGHYLTEIHDPLGRTPIRNEYGPDGRLTRHVDAFGHEILYDHQLDGRREVVTNRLGASRLLDYDARGNVVHEVDETGLSTVRTFDADDQLLSESIGGLPATTYAYDANRNLTRTTDPLGHATLFTYDAKGNVLTTTDPRGAVTTNAYDARGNLVSTIDPAGGSTAYTYDAKGNLLSETDALGHASAFVYDARGNLTRETDALGSVATYSYDTLGNRRSETRTRTLPDGTLEPQVTGYIYDAMGRLLATTAPDGSVTRSEYDALGNVAATVDALDRRTEHTYDALGRMTRTDYADGTHDAAGYDAENRRTTFIDRGGRTTTYEYDAAGRLRRTYYPDGAVVEQVYDVAGRLSSTIDPRAHATAYGYDAAGRRTSVTDALGHMTSWSYDAAGNATSVTDARGFTTASLYDALGRLTRTVFPDGTERRTEYDALGRRTAEIDEAGARTEFGYDAVGRLVSVTDALGQVTSYGYDEVGNRIAQTDANGHVTRFELDSLGRQTKRILPGGAEERFTYDAAGQRRTRTAFDGVVTHYAYDLAGRLATRTYPGGRVESFTYTPSGRRATATDARGTTSYGYDARDRVTSILSPDGRSLAFAYDLAGNRLSTTADVAGQSLPTQYTYDALNRLETVTDPDGKVTVHGYDANGNRESLAFPNGVATVYDYDARNRLTHLVAVSPVSGVVSSYAYTLSPTGNRARIEEQDGTTRSYGYDALYRLTDEQVTSSPAPGSPTLWRNVFGYDPVGNRLTQQRTETTGGTHSVAYGYDARDRLLTEDSTTYGWDENGNLTSKSGPEGATYVWDDENRLTAVNLANGTVVEHTYDVDGTRIRTRTTPATGPPTTTDYLVDPWHQTSAAGRGLVLSQVIAETDEAGNLTAYHVRGDDLLATLRPNPTPPPGESPWIARYLHAEGIGTVRALTDEQGNVTDRYTLEAFGTLLDHLGDDPNAYLFAGEPLDPNSGFYYNRARWVDSRAGRFESADPRVGSSFEPLTLHRYLYAGASATNLVDPSGEDFQAVALAAVNAAIGILQTALVFSVLGAIGGAADAYFAEADVAAGFVSGMKVGFATGLLWRLKFLRPTLTALGLTLGATATFQAFMDGDTGLALFRGIVFVAGVAGVVTAGGTHPGGEMIVYRSVNSATGEIQYVGITRNLAARAAAHLRQKGIEIEPIGGIEDLSMTDARNVEEALIVYYGLGKNGGTLLNRIHSISPRSPIYAERLSRGVQLLRGAGYPDI